MSQCSRLGPHIEALIHLMSVSHIFDCHKSRMSQYRREMPFNGIVASLIEKII